MTSVHPPPPQSPSSPLMEQYTDTSSSPSLRSYALFGLALIREYQCVMFFESYAVVLWNVTQRKKEAAQRDIVKNTCGEVFSWLGAIAVNGNTTETNKVRVNRAETS